MRGGHRLMVVFSVLRYSLAFSSTKPRTFSMLSFDRMGVSKSKSYFSVRTSQDPRHSLNSLRDGSFLIDKHFRIIWNLEFHILYF